MGKYADEQAHFETIGQRADEEIAGVIAQVATLTQTVADRESTIAALEAAKAAGLAREDAAAETIAKLQASIDTLNDRIAELEAAQAQPAPAAEYGPVKAATVADLSSQLQDFPADANPVLWPHDGPRDASLNDVVRTLGPNDLLILPEATESYLIDTSKGFQRYGQAGPWGEATTDSLYDEMIRATRGIAGMGPGTVIELGASDFSRPYQRKAVETGCVVIGTSTPKAYFGNFTMHGRDLGTMAYSALRFNGRAVDSHYERLSMLGAHRGFRNSPGGEAAAIVMLADRGTARRVEVDCRDASGKRVGASPLMSGGNSSDHLVEDSYFHHAYAGMPVWYRVHNATVRAPDPSTTVRADPVAPRPTTPRTRWVGAWAAPSGTSNTALGRSSMRTAPSSRTTRTTSAWRRTPVPTTAWATSVLTSAADRTPLAA